MIIAKLKENGIYELFETYEYTDPVTSNVTEQYRTIGDWTIDSINERIAGFQRELAYDQQKLEAINGIVSQ